MDFNDFDEAKEVFAVFLVQTSSDVYAADLSPSWFIARDGCDGGAVLSRWRNDTQNTVVVAQGMS